MKKWMMLLVSVLPVLVSAQDVPVNKTVDVLEDGKGTPLPYLAFPALLDLDSEVLVSFKRGKSHAADPGAVLDLLSIDGRTGKVTPRRRIAEVAGEIMQMGEWARFPDGSIANYIDAQRKGQPSRTGLLAIRSTDKGKTFGPPERVGVVDGVEYGYMFEAVTRGPTTWMLAMTFTNLVGGVYPKVLSRGVAGSVDVIQSDDNGKNWRFVKSLTRELGHASINESSFAPYGDGFIVAVRGYGAQQWLLRTDASFNVTHKKDIAKEESFRTPLLGRPRVFMRDGRWYLLTRNVTAPKTPMRLSLFRFDPETLKATRHVLLDNAEGEKVADAYYAVPYWREENGKTRFHVVTYKRDTGTPKIIRLSFDWEEVR